ncbi:MAG: glycosyltransferase family 39 protein [Tepidisphaeraceae bacterium]|jgi:dolichyl-phosphate-mannose-protein mannosyltransferase
MTEPPPIAASTWHHSRPNRIQIIALIFVLIAGAFLRFYRIGNPSLWMDEMVSIELAMGHRSAHDFFPDSVIRTDQPDPLNLAAAAPWWDIWNRVQITTHPPLYFVLLRWWMNLLGAGPAATRCLSAILSLAGIAVFFDVCRLLHGPRVGLLAACMMALAIGQLDFAQEARSYPLLILQGMSCCDVLVRIVFSGATLQRLIFLVFLLASMLLTHYFAAGAFAAMGVYSVIRLRRRDRRRTLAAFFAAAAISVAAWGCQFYGQMRTLPNFDPSYLRESSPNHAIHILLRIAELPLKYCFGEVLAEGLPLVVHVVAAGVVVALMLRLRHRPDLLLWVLWGAGIVLFVAASDLTHHFLFLQYARYTVLASPALYAILAGVHWPRLKYVSDFFPLGVVVSLALAAGFRVQRGVPPKQDFQRLSQIIDAYADPHELLIFYNDSGWVSPGVWYVGYKYYSPDSVHPWVTLHHAPDSKLLGQLPARGTFWLVGPAPELFGAALFPGWQPDVVWHTTAGGVCLMRNTAQPDSVR